MVKEPQGVLELMEQTEAAWERQIAACDDATGPARASLREALRALRTEYAEADYPRREAIGAELRALIRRYEALGGVARAEAAPHAPVPLGVEAGIPRSHAAAPEAEEPAPPPHTPVPLGVETAPLPPGAAPEPRTRREAAGFRPSDAPHAPVPLGVEAGRAPNPAPPVPPRGVAPEPEPVPEAAPEPAAEPPRPEPPGPVPHGDPGPGYRHESPSGEAGGDARTEAPRSGEDGGRTSVWGRVRHGALRWARVARTAVEHEVLRKKREERLMEVGVRVRQLAAREALGGVAGDAGVRERLRQVEQVDAAIRDNRDRYADLTRPGG